MGLFTKKPEPKPVSYIPKYTHTIELYKDSLGKWGFRIYELTNETQGVTIAYNGHTYESEHATRIAVERLRHALQNGTYRVDVEGE